MNKVLSVFILCCFFYLKLNAVRFLGIIKPELWTIWKKPVLCTTLKNSEEDCFNVLLMDHALNLICYKIYVEKIPNNEENVKIRVAYELRCFPAEPKWINLMGDLIVSKKDLESRDFGVGVSIFGSKGDNSYNRVTTEITVNDRYYYKERVVIGERFAFMVKQREEPLF